MPEPAESIRNVALVGHRGAGKTSVDEALLFEAGALPRLGRVEDGTTASDAAADERARRMSIAMGVASFRWRDCKVNLIDTPGEPSFAADALAALRVCESAVFVVNATAGVETGTERLWRQAERLGRARLLFVNMLDRERADFFAALESLKRAFGPHVVATEIPIGAEHGLEGIVDLVDMRAFRYGDGGRASAVEIPIPEGVAARAEEYRERLMDEVAEASDELMERYLDGDEISHDETIEALESEVEAGAVFPVTCGAATRNLGTDRLLDALVEDLPSPAQHGAVAAGDGLELTPDPERDAVALVFKTLADPYAGRISLFRVFQGTVEHDSQLVNCRAGARERVGALLVREGKGERQVAAVGPGDIGAVAKLKQTRAGDVLAAREQRCELPAAPLPRAAMAFAIAARNHGDDDKVAEALRRLCEEDPALDVHRDEETGEQIVAGLSQLHVEVVVGRMRERFGAEVELRPPRVPYHETIRAAARARGRHKKQTGGRGQFADCTIEVEPLAEGHGFEFVDRIRGGAIPGAFVPAVEKGVREAMRAGPVAGYPVDGVRVTLVDGAHHSVDSSEMAFKVAGALAFREAVAAADPVLLEPVMALTVAVPEECVGDAIGDLSARRGRPLGMEPQGGTTVVRAEAPLAELLDYAPDLRSLTGGRGEYALEIARYEPVPPQVASKVAPVASAE